ncbi:MAG: UPF0182 family protein, partial [Acidobacteriota bacterium]|nr:UPF0182 family protein [Acidobacteriota bacterium]
MNKSSAQAPPDDFEGEVIDIKPQGGAGRHKARRWALAVVVVALLVAASRAGSVYLETLWFGSLGYASVYWTAFRYEWATFAVFAVATAALLRAAFWLMERAFVVSALAPRRVIVNNQPVFVKPARLLKPAAWVVSLLLGLLYGLGMSGDWQRFALWLNRPPTGDADPVFGRPLGFYLFTLPVAQALSSWLLTMAWVVLLGAGVYAVLGLLPTGKDVRKAFESRAAMLSPTARGAVYAALSAALALLLVGLALRAY